jgi:hypothetical protein
MTTYKLRAFLCVIALGSGACLAGEGPGNCGPHGTQEILAIQASSDLSTRSFGNCVAFDRLSTPPTVVTFVIPKGQVFVVTSIDWFATVPSLASRSMLANFFTAVSATVNGASATSVALADSTGFAGGNVLFPTTGVVIRPGQQLCVAVLTQPGTNSFAPADAVAHGYLAADSQ